MFKVSQSAIRSNAKAIAFASAVKIDDPSGIRIVSEKLSDTITHPTFISSLEPSVQCVNSSCNVNSVLGN